MIPSNEVFGIMEKFVEGISYANLRTTYPWIPPATFKKMIRDFELQGHVTFEAVTNLYKYNSKGLKEFKRIEAIRFREVSNETGSGTSVSNESEGEPDDSMPASPVDP